MALVSEIINRSLRLIGAIDALAATDAVDSQTAIVALNALCNRWEANGLAMGWVDVSDPDDTFPAPVEAEEAITYQLALRLAAEYGVAPRGDVAAFAMESLAALRRDRLAAAPLTLASDLPRPLHWNIYTDEAV